MTGLNKKGGGLVPPIRIMRGYTVALVKANRKAPKHLIGVELGAACIQADVPVAEVAKHFGVSRQAVYAWFCGRSTPHLVLHSKIEKYIKELA
jgi:DNA-binding XRE family transcriptional regulator